MYKIIQFEFITLTVNKLYEDKIESKYEHVHSIVCRRDIPNECNRTNSFTIRHSQMIQHFFLFSNFDASSHTYDDVVFAIEVTRSRRRLSRQFVHKNKVGSFNHHVDIHVFRPWE